MFCKGMRLAVRKLCNFIIKHTSMICHIAGDIYTSRMHIITSQHSFKFKRIHIPSVISINKLQGQSMKTADWEIKKLVHFSCEQKNNQRCILQWKIKSSKTDSSEFNYWYIFWHCVAKSGRGGKCTMVAQHIMGTWLVSYIYIKPPQQFVCHNKQTTTLY